MLYDLIIIGGGINGCGCAADAATRGLSVFLCEQDDLASKTSSSSSKLIHGGLRYLENYDFKLVKKSLDEQQTLMDIAPHLVEPLPFVLAASKKSRSMWKLRAGLFIYNNLSKNNQLPQKKYINRQNNFNYFKPLLKNFSKGFVYYDCKTDDARLTITNALQAKKYGATISLHSKVIGAQVINNIWHLTIHSASKGTFTITAKAIINAAGPWIKDVEEVLKIPPTMDLALIKGSHIVVRKLYEGNHAYLLQNSDKRVIFVLPYNGYSMIGTTEENCTNKPDDIKITEMEAKYLLSALNKYFKTSLSTKDILNTWSGVRPLIANKTKSASKLSRDYFIHYNNTPAPSVTIYGGKITTYRLLSAEVIDKLQPIFPRIKKSQTNTIILPGGYFKDMDLIDYKEFAHKKYHWLEKSQLNRYLSVYGSLTENILKNCKNINDLGMSFNSLLYQVEVDYLIKEEWASTIDDILWRRTKLGLQLNTEQQKKLQDYIKAF